MPRFIGASAYARLSTMRVARTIVAVVFFATGVAACSGNGAGGFHCLSGDPHCRDPLVESFALRTEPFYQSPPAPIAIGASIDVTFETMRCLENGSQSGPPPGSGCSPWYAPTTISGVAQPFQRTGAPCPVTVVQTAPGKLHMTRTGPGDPSLTAYGSTSSGFCLVLVSTPDVDRTNSVRYGVYL